MYTYTKLVFLPFLVMMIKQKILIVVMILLSLGFSNKLKAQKAGNYTYDFLTLTNSARVGALGGNQVGMNTGNVDLVFHNPAALSDTLHQSLVFNYVPYVSDIKMTYVGYAHHVNTIGTFGLSIHSINYGTFDRADVDGHLNGTFSAAEYAINLSYAKALSPNLQAGISLKPIISNLEQYNSFGLAADIGVLYNSDNRLFSAGLTFKNIGSQITTYNDIYEPLPSDLQIGISKKLAHAPFRFSLTAQDLFDWSLKYNVEDGNGIAIEDEGNNEGAFDQLMRHLVMGVEIVPSDNFYIAMGYNHRRRKELGVSEKMSTIGFSWGFGFRVYKFHFAYGSARYHLGGSSNHFSISTNLNNFRK